MDSKPWYASKTIWANALATIATVATAFGLDLGLDTKTQAEIVVGFLAVLNIVLRLVTTKPVAVISSTES